MSRATEYADGMSMLSSKIEGQMVFEQNLGLKSFGTLGLKSFGTLLKSLSGLHGLEGSSRPHVRLYLQ